MSSPAPQESPTTDGKKARGGLARHTAVYAVGMIITRLASFVMLPIYTRHLTPADYGVMSLIELTLDFISLLGGAELAVGVFRFYHKATTERERQAAVATSFLLIAGVYAIVGLIAFTLAKPLATLIFADADKALLFQIAAGNIALSAWSIVPIALARILNKSTLVVGLGVLKLFVQLAFVLVLLVKLQLGVKAVLLSALVGNAVAGVLSIYWLGKRIRYQWSRETAAMLLVFGAPLMATKIAAYLTTFADRWFLQAATGEAAVGLYSLSYQFGFILVMVGYGPVAQTWEPRRFELLGRSDAGALLSRGFLVVNLLLFTAAVGISLFVRDLLRVLTTPEFVPAADVVPLILVAYIFYSWSHTLDLGILASERTKYLTIAHYIVAAVAVLAYWLLIPRYLHWGAAGATLVAFGLHTLLVYTFSQRLHPIQYEWRPVLTLAAWSVLIASASLALPELPIQFSIGVHGLAFSLYLFGVWHLPILGAGDRERAQQLLTSSLRTARDFFRRSR